MVNNQWLVWLSGAGGAAAEDMPLLLLITARPHP